MIVHSMYGSHIIHIRVSLLVITMYVHTFLFYLFDILSILSGIALATDDKYASSVTLSTLLVGLNIIPTSTAINHKGHKKHSDFLYD